MLETDNLQREVIALRKRVTDLEAQLHVYHEHEKTPYDSAELLATRAEIEQRVEQRTITLQQAVARLLEELTKRDMAERRNAELTEAYRALVDYSLQGLCIFQDNRVVFANPQMKAMTGYTVEELLTLEPEQIYQAIHPEDRDKVWKNMLGRIEGKSIPSQYQCRLLHRDGTVRWLEIFAVAIFYRGRPATQAAFIDSTEQKYVEEALHQLNATLEHRVDERTAELRHNQALLQGLLDNFPAAVFVVDTQERYLLVNKYGAEQLSSAEPAALIGQASQTFTIPEIATCWEQTNQQVRKTGKPIQIEETAHVGDSTVTYLTIKFPIFDEYGAVFAVGGVATDITERKNMEVAMQQAKEAAEAGAHAKSAFLANMSHEIRTPLNAIIGMSSLLLDTPLSAEQQDYIQTIHISGDALLRVINDILDLSKIEAGRLELDYDTFNLRTCVEEALELLAPTASEKGLELAYWIEDDVPEDLIGDVTRVWQVIVNLLSNAIKFTEQGEVVVTIHREPLHPSYTEEQQHHIHTAHRESLLAKAADANLCMVHVCVRDTGIGISPDRMDRLFQAFTQLDSSTTRRYGGTGLGLAISKRLTEMMDGTLSVESVLGKGSTFQLTFVAALSPEKSSIRQELSPDDILSGKRVLIVDDNTTTCTILERYAIQWGMVPTVASSGAEALQHMRQGKWFDCAFIDMQMPEMDGLTLIHTIHTIVGTTQAFPMGLWCSLRLRSEIEKQLNLDNVVLLVKPVRPALLHNTLVSLFRGKPMQHQWHDSWEHVDRHMVMHHPLRILLAEDNVVNQKVALRLLEKLGYHADIACNGLEAFHALLWQSFDVILMDVHMPEMDGVEATKRIRAEIPAEQQPWVIALTAYALQGNREWLMEAVMDDYLSKPVRIEDLETALQKVNPITYCRPRIGDRAQGIGDGQQGIGDGQQGIGDGAQSQDEPCFTEKEATMQQHDSSIDEETLAGLAEMLDDDEGFHELLGLYLDDTPRLLATMWSSMQHQSFDDFTRAAHSLKSSSAQVGALNLSAYSAELERMGKMHQGEEAMSNMLVQAEGEYGRVQAALRKRLETQD